MKIINHVCGDYCVSIEEDVHTLVLLEPELQDQVNLYYWTSKQDVLAPPFWLRTFLALINLLNKFNFLMQRNISRIAKFLW